MSETKQEETPIVRIEGNNNLNYGHYIHLFSKVNKGFNCVSSILGSIFTLIGIIFLIILNDKEYSYLSIIVMIAGILLLVLFSLNLFLLPFKSYKANKNISNHLDFYKDRLEIITPEGNVPVVKVPYSTFYKIEEYKNAYFFYSKFHNRKLGIAFSKDLVNKDGIYFFEGLKK